MLDSNGVAGPHAVTEFSQTAAGSGYRAPQGGVAKFLRAWAAVENTIVGLLAAATLAIVVYTIFMRFFIPRLTPAWADEMSVYLMIWATFIALSGVTAQNGHVRADLITNALSEKPRVALEFLSYVCGVIFAGILCYYGYAVTMDAREFGDLSTTTLRFPMWIYYACLPVGAGLIALRYLVLVLLMAGGYRTERPAH